MRNTELEQLTVDMVTQYYKMNNEPFFTYADENILWLGPRAGQMISSKEALVSFFTAETTSLTFSLRGMTAYDVQTGPGRWEIILQFLVTTIFPTGEMHEHNQRMQFSWVKKTKGGKGKSDTDSGPDYTIRVLNISNLGLMEKMSLYAKSASESAEDASYVHTPGERGPICIFKGMHDESYYLSVSEILYLESESRARHCVIHFLDANIPPLACREKLNTIQERYPDAFFRPHICYLINPLYVTEISRFRVKLLGGKVLPIPEKKYTSVKEALRQRLEQRK